MNTQDQITVNDDARPRPGRTCWLGPRSRSHRPFLGWVRRSIRGVRFPYEKAGAEATDARS